jgi:N-carbamoyl-L-amino-acid hydrolase
MYAVTDVKGCTFRDELARIGYLGEAPCRADPIHRYFELHIEQGPVLDREGIPIGIVTGLVGLEWFEATFRGQANHSGTTPMEGRRDALLAAADVISAVNSIPKQLDAEYAVATVGHLRVEPNSINIVPGVVHLTIDVRASDAENLRRAAVLADRAIQQTATKHHLEVDHRKVASSEPQVFDAGCIALVEQVVKALNVPFRRMVSGAAHDANNLNRICPTSMIFVPSVGGISHNEAEFTKEEDLIRGADVLLGVITAAAEE